MESQTYIDDAAIREQQRQRDDLITALMIKYATREEMTTEEMQILEEWCQESPENQKFMEQFGDLNWIRNEIKKLKATPKRQIWFELNEHLDKIGAPDDRWVKEWYDPETPMPWKIWLRIGYYRLLCWLRLRKHEDVFPL